MTPLKYPHASANHVLEHMKPEMFYTSPDLAQSFGVPKQYIQDLLWKMGRAGDVERIRLEDRTFVWARIVKRARGDQNTSVAGPAYPPYLKSTMHGYDAQFRDRMQLAMMGRGR